MTRSDRFIDLLDWRRRVSDMYGRVRAEPDASMAWTIWCKERGALFAEHPQSPLREEERDRFSGLSYGAYDRAARVVGMIEDAAPQHFDIAASDGSSYGFTRFATVRFSLHGRELELELYWLDGYGGGLFLPFRDHTSGKTTYGGGRYLLDTVKGADLGMDGEGLVMDFNFAYNPSCSYDPRWVCPLAPPANHLDVAVAAGELTP